MEMVTLYFARADANTTLWMMFVSVSFGVLGLQASGAAFSRALVPKVLLSLAFGLFAFLNYTANYDNEYARRHIGDYIRAQLSAESTKLGSDALRQALDRAKPTDQVEDLWKLHLFLDLVVLSGIWGLPEISRRGKLLWKQGE
jgi:hypothetical protein